MEVGKSSAYMLNYVCLSVCLFTVSIRGVSEIPGVAGLSAECRQKVY